MAKSLLPLLESPQTLGLALTNRKMSWFWVYYQRLGGILFILWETSSTVCISLGFLTVCWGIVLKKAKVPWKSNPEAKPPTLPAAGWANTTQSEPPLTAGIMSNTELLAFREFSTIVHLFKKSSTSLVIKEMQTKPENYGHSSPMRCVKINKNALIWKAEPYNLFGRQFVNMDQILKYVSYYTSWILFLKDYINRWYLSTLFIILKLGNFH